jgi:type VI protein secretion system component VasK
MKPLLLAILLIGFSQLQSQNVENLLKKTTKDTTVNRLLGSVKKGNISTDDIAAGLKEALSTGVQKGTAQLSAADGFFKNAAVKILMPLEASKAEKALRDMGLGAQVDDVILSMNRAAEDAAKSAVPIFTDAIKQMSIQDAASILKGTDTAATMYLKQKTSASLNNIFNPIVKQSLSKVDATKYWNTAFSTYNKIPFVKKVNTDLNAYVTEKALNGVYYQIAQEEQKIRKNPAAQTSELLKKVFGKN